MEHIIVVASAALMGGFVQSVTGFGGAIMIMIFLPLIFSMNAAPAVSDVITMILSFSMLYRYRRAVKIKKIILPAIVYLITSTIVIHQSAQADAQVLKLIFGLFLILLSLYFILFAGKLEVRPSVWLNMVCAALAGVCGGLFGISGPPASLYYLAATKSKEEYLGTLNAFFSFTVIFNIWSRISSGFLTMELMPPIAVGIMAILAGCSLGSRISGKISMETMRKCVYGLMLFAGTVSVLQGI